MGSRNTRSCLADADTFNQKLLATSGALVAFNRTLSFPEHDTLLVALPWIKRQLSIENIEVLMVEQAVEGSKGWSETTVNAAEPGKPGVVFYNL
jgi:leucyl-tRNA synthetase